MILYLIRHGKDDDNIRGGWSHHSLTEKGKQQALDLAAFLKLKNDINIHRVYSSDLPRSMETAEEIARQYGLTVIALPQFREVNNGDLAGMSNVLAAKRFPKLYWNLIEWNQAYPHGESPKAFYERILTAWIDFSHSILKQNRDCILVTHGGVLQIILSFVNGIPYNNKELYRKIQPCEIIALKYEDDTWIEIK